MKIIIGMVLGAAGLAAFMAFGPAGTEGKARAAGKAAVTAAKTAQEDYCRKSFLEETACFQNFPAEKCAEMLDQKCGKGS